MKLNVFLEINAQAWYVQFVTCLEIEAKWDENVYLILTLVSFHYHS